MSAQRPDETPAVAAHDADRAQIDAILRDGDEGAFRELYRRHTPRLWGFSLRLLAGAAASVEVVAEEVVQETWVRAVRNLRQFRGGSTFSTWLLGIAHNLCREHYRREKGRLGADPADLDGPAASRGDGDLRVDLARAIAALPEGCRAVLLLHDLEGFTHVEIGRDLGISPGTSKSQLFEARRRVRTWLRGESP